MTQAILYRELRPLMNLRGGAFTGTDHHGRRMNRLERDRMEEILEDVEERLNSLGSHFDVDATRTELGYIRVAVINLDPALKSQEEEITVLD